MYHIMSLAKGFHYSPLSSSSELLLEKGSVDSSSDPGEVVASHHQRRVCGRFSLGALSIHLLIILVYTTIFGFLLDRVSDVQSVLPGASLLQSPAKEAYRIEKRLLHNGVHRKSPFKGVGPDADEAWHDLLKNSNIRLSAEELREMNRTSVSFADGSPGYLGTLDVFHQLHCLKYIRHYIHRDHYTIFKTNVPSAEHVDHCIDSLRQYVMCRTDPAIQTYSWIPTLRIPWANFDTEHDCVNWDALNGWAEERSVDIYNPGTLEHPTLGQSFPPGWYEAQRVEEENSS